jgi:hypothetical protein
LYSPSNSATTVAVDDALGVCRIEGVGNLDRQVQKLRRLHGLPTNAVLERLALQKLHGDEGLALVLVDVVDRADVGVVEGGAGLGLALEPLQGDGVAEELLGQELQRDGPVEAGVLGLVDDTHAAAANLLEDAVVRDGLADHGWTQSVGTRRFSSSNQFWTTTRSYREPADPA